MSPESLKSTLAALRSAGSVFGVLFSRDGETLFSDLAYSPERVADLTQVLNDIEQYFVQEERAPEYLSFGFDGGNLLLILREGYRIVILYHHADEADFILSAGSAFLTDFLSGKAAEALQVSKEVATLPKGGGPSGRKVDPTAPITPVMR